MSISSFAMYAVLGLIAAAALEAFLKRKRKRRSLHEHFTGIASTKSEKKRALGTEAIDFDIVDAAQTANHHTSGMSDQSRSIKKTNQ